MKISNVIILCLLLIIVFMTVVNNTTPVNGFSGMKTTTSIYTPVPTPIYTPVPTPIPTPIQIYSYDNIRVDHKIELCKPIPTHIYEKSESEEWYTDCGITTFVLGNYPLDLLPSGGGSGIISDSEMVLAKVTINGGISLIPWETVDVKMRWYDASENRLMFYTTQQNANSFNNDVTSFLGRFSWEINKKGQYYVDVITEYGDARVVFNVI